MMIESRLRLDGRGGCSGGVNADSSVSTGAAVADSVEWIGIGSVAESPALSGFLGAETKSSMLTSPGTRSGFQYEGGWFFCKYAGVWSWVCLFGRKRGGEQAKAKCGGPSTALRFGRDDASFNFWAERAFHCGLQGRDGGGFCGECLGVGGFFCGCLLGLQHGFEELGDGAFAFCGLAEFGAWGEDA